MHADVNMPCSCLHADSRALQLSQLWYQLLVSSLWA